MINLQCSFLDVPDFLIINFKTWAFGSLTER